MDEIIELIETAAGEEMDEDGVALAHALRRETDGNPFFVAELLRHLVDSGAVTMDGSGRFSARRAGSKSSPSRRACATSWGSGWLVWALSCDGSCPRRR